MLTVRDQSHEDRLETLERVLAHFVKWTEIEYKYLLYDYQITVARTCLYSLLVEPIGVFIKIFRQAGKTQGITLLVRFLIVFFRFLLRSPLMCGIASPKGEQAKTDVDRIKRSMADFRVSWQAEDREFNSHTVRAFRHGNLHAEIFHFSLTLDDEQRIDDA